MSYAADQARIRRIQSMAQIWVDTHPNAFGSAPKIVQQELKALAREHAENIVRAGRNDAVIITKDDYEAMMLKLVTQLRRKRQGNIENCSTAEWTAQCQAIATELNWVWVAKQREAA